MKLCQVKEKYVNRLCFVCWNSALAVAMASSNATELAWIGIILKKSSQIKCNTKMLHKKTIFIFNFNENNQLN